MANTTKILGQAVPVATTLTDLYMPSGASGAVVSSFTVCNRGPSAATFRAGVAAGGAADNLKHYWYYDVEIPANDTFVRTAGDALSTTDVVRVYASNATLSFQATGVEIT